jgi:hypothetical protein
MDTNTLVQKLNQHATTKRGWVRLRNGSIAQVIEASERTFKDDVDWWMVNPFEDEEPTVVATLRLGRPFPDVPVAVNGLSTRVAVNEGTFVEWLEGEGHELPMLLPFDQEAPGGCF